MFNAKIISPRDGYLLADDFGNAEMFLRFFKKKFDTKTYIDIYTKDFIYHTDESLIKEISDPTPNKFGEVPVRVGAISQYKEQDTLFNELKDLQDAFETNLSDIVNEISDYRLAYLIFTGCQLDTTNEDDDGKTQLDYLKEKGAMAVNEKEAKVQFLLIINYSFSFIKPSLSNIRKLMFKTIATTVANPMPVISKFPITTLIPLKPTINITDERIKFLDLAKSTFSSINVLNPDTAIVPNNKKLTPPITGVGIVLISADILPEKPKTIDINPAPHIMYTLYIFVSAITPMFSP